MAKSDTRERLLSAAREIFSEVGYTAATVREIADRAGVREITLFRHFESKEKLFYEAVTENVKSLSLDSLLPDFFRTKLSGDLRSTLLMLANAYFSFCLESLPFMRVGIMEAPRNPEFASYISEIPRMLEEHLVFYLNSLYEEGKIPKTDNVRIAKMFYGILFSHIFSNYMFKSDAEIHAEQDEQMLETCVNLFVKGIGA